MGIHKYDNTMLAVYSIKHQLTDYINSQGWRNLYGGVFLNSEIAGKKITTVSTQNRKRGAIVLPLIVIDIGFVYNKAIQLTDEHGRDMISISILVRAANMVELMTLSNLVRKKISDWVFPIYNYQVSAKTKLGTGEFESASMQNISFPDAEEATERFGCMINADLEINSQNFLN